MERKIGEIFEYEGEWYQCVMSPDTVCDHCDLVFSECNENCLSTERCDKADVIFKKLEKVGEPCCTHGHIVQRYSGVITPIVLPKETFAIFDNEICNTVSIEVKRGEEDMEESERAMPKTWEQCLTLLNDIEYVGAYGKVKEAKISENFPTFSDSTKNDWRYAMPRGLGKPMLALCQLLVCRNAWWKQLGWKPEWWNATSTKYCVGIYEREIVIKTQSAVGQYILAFPTPEVRDQFLETFRDLIGEARVLL